MEARQEIKIYPYVKPVVFVVTEIEKKTSSHGPWLLLYDSLQKEYDQERALEIYFSELHRFFLKKVRSLSVKPTLSEDEEDSLRAMLDSLITIKRLQKNIVDVVEESF